MKGRVIKSTGSWYEIETENGKKINARLKGKFRIKGIKSTNPIAVGDWVLFEFEGEEGVIYDILERKNYIIRRSINLSKQTQIIAANVDQLFLVVTIENPTTTLGFIDRFLIGAEAYRIPVTLVYNKIDLLTNEKQLSTLKLWKKIYSKAGYQQIEVSALNGEGLVALRNEMKTKVSIFSGHSGVGKSTLANTLDSNLNLRTNEISDSHQSGKHTTTFAEMHSLNFGGKIIDTPGIKGFGNVDLEKGVIAHYFKEMRERMEDCKFSNCLHINEPNCAIKHAVEIGDIAQSRYHNYLSIFNEDESENYRQKGY